MKTSPENAFKKVKLHEIYSLKHYATWKTFGTSLYILDGRRWYQHSRLIIQTRKGGDGGGPLHPYDARPKYKKMTEPRTDRTIDFRLSDCPFFILLTTLTAVTSAPCWRRSSAMTTCLFCVANIRGVLPSYGHTRHGHNYTYPNIFMPLLRHYFKVNNCFPEPKNQKQSPFPSVPCILTSNEVYLAFITILISP